MAVSQNAAPWSALTCNYNASIWLLRLAPQAGACAVFLFLHYSCTGINARNYLSCAVGKRPPLVRLPQASRLSCLSTIALTLISLCFWALPMPYFERASQVVVKDGCFTDVAGDNITNLKIDGVWEPLSSLKPAPTPWQLADSVFALLKERNVPGAAFFAGDKEVRCHLSTVQPKVPFP